MKDLLAQSQRKLTAEMNLYSFKSNSVSEWTQ